MFGDMYQVLTIFAVLWVAFWCLGKLRDRFANTVQKPGV